MNESAAWVGGSWVVVDRDHFDRPEEAEFDSGRLAGARVLPGGRGEAVEFAHRNTRYVLRHYRRGGLLARLLVDVYPRVPRNLSRPAREWRVLRRLRALGLPTPVPAAWRLSPAGGVLYRADLITLRIPGGRPLPDVLAERSLESGEWERIGATIGRFHRAGLLHPDLSAGNVLLDGAGGAHLVDFDRARLGPPPPKAAREAMIDRLGRSLRKLRRLDPALHWEEEDLEPLRSGCLRSTGRSRH